MLLHPLASPSNPLSSRPAKKILIIDYKFNKTFLKILYKEEKIQEDPNATILSSVKSME